MKIKSLQTIDTSCSSGSECNHYAQSHIFSGALSLSGSSVHPFSGSDYWFDSKCSPTFIWNYIESLESNQAHRNNKREPWTWTKPNTTTNHEAAADRKREYENALIVNIFELEIYFFARFKYFPHQKYTDFDDAHNRRASAPHLLSRLVINGLLRREILTNR